MGKRRGQAWRICDKGKKMKKPLVQEDLCVGCGICCDNCPKKVFELHDTSVMVVKDSACDGCNICVETCPRDAIIIQEL